MPGIFELLAQDHRKVQDLLAGITQCPPDEMPRSLEFLTQVRDLLRLHMKFEEETFYPETEQRTGAEKDISDAIHDHDEARALIDELLRTDPHSLNWIDKAAELKIKLDRHIDEEEGKLFQQAREAMSAAKAEDLGRDYLALKQSATG
jgi:hemerythrin-like domain-containing protein